jgi:hypothetical protein
VISASVCKLNERSRSGSFSKLVADYLFGGELRNRGYYHRIPLCYATSTLSSKPALFTDRHEAEDFEWLSIMTVIAYADLDSLMADVRSE